MEPEPILDDGLPMADFGGVAAAPSGLTRPEKAAVVVRLLLAEGAELSLADLPEAVQNALVLQMSRMRPVDHATIEAVAEEFASQIEAIGLSFPKGIAGALGALGGALSPVAAERFRRELGEELQGDPWARIEALGTDQLLPVMEAEAIEVAAVVLAKLPVAKAAEMMGRLPGPRARRIAYAMSRTEAVRPDLVNRIGRAILRQLDTRPPAVFSDGPVERVGAILNFSPAATREDVLAGLDETDRDFADEVRKAIFTFANIPERIDSRDVAKIVKAVDQPVLITALQAAATARRWSSSWPT